MAVAPILRIRSLAANQGFPLFGEITEAQAFVQLTHQKQPAVGSDSRPLEIDFQRSVGRELQGLVLLLTHRVLTSGRSSAR